MFQGSARFSKQTTYDSHTQRLPNKRCWEYPCQNVSAFEKAYKPMLRNKPEKKYYTTSKPMSNINMQGNKMQGKTTIKMQNKFKTDKETICSICVRFWNKLTRMLTSPELHVLAAMPINYVGTQSGKQNRTAKCREISANKNS